MRNVVATIAIATLWGCATTPCEQEADLRAACSSSTADDKSIEEALPECAEDSVDACVASCGLDHEDQLCAILDQAATEVAIVSYTDCLSACAEDAP